MKRLLAAIVMTVPVLVGCAATVETAPCGLWHDFQQARRRGPADYLYAESDEAFRQAQNVGRIIAALEGEMDNNRQIIARLSAAAATVRCHPYMSPLERDARLDTYVAEIRRLQDRLLNQRCMLGDLRLQQGALMGRSRLEQVRAAAVEEGRAPIATY